MNGYATHNHIGIRFRSGVVDVPLGTSPHNTYVSFPTSDEAKAFIDGGRRVQEGVHTVYDMSTQEPVQ